LRVVSIVSHCIGFVIPRHRERIMLGTSFSSIARRDWVIILPCNPVLGLVNEPCCPIPRLLLCPPYYAHEGLTLPIGRARGVVASRFPVWADELGAVAPLRGDRLLQLPRRGRHTVLHTC
jgi:hypothetical protein